MSSHLIKQTFKDILVDLPNSPNNFTGSTEYSGPSLLWHDYETWGVDPQHDFPCQFAAIRTDLDLNIIGKPISYFCQIPNDYIPHPEACLVTGITPQQSIRDGFIEAEFARKIAQAMAQMDTCVVGYNSIRFDDEVTRFLRYRNFYDPYEREWKNGNSRWDIIDLARACYALRPEGINWPIQDDGTPSFKLEALSKANALEHENAHDAVSDVQATIAFAKLLKEKQEKLFSFYFSLRNKNTVLQTIDVQQQKPFLHISGMLPAKNGCCSWFVPICMHPNNKNAIICIDLATDLSIFTKLDASELKKRLYTKASDLAEGESRPGVKLIHINKSPFVAPAKTLTPELAARLCIDREKCLKNVQYLKSINDIEATLVRIFEANEDMGSAVDIDAALYSRGFSSSADKQWMEKVKAAEPEQLAVWQAKAPDALYAEQLQRYRARNFPHTLDQNELESWQRHRKYRFTETNKKSCLAISECQQKIEVLATHYGEDKKKMNLLSSLTRYLEDL